MSKIIHLIRHGQSTFNAAVAHDHTDPLHFDARLTALGREQVAAARAAMAAVPVELAVSSPLTRAIETTLGIFGGRNVPILVEPLHRELLESSCDIGRPPSELKREFPGLAFDHLADPWWHDHPEKDEHGIAIEPHEIFLERLGNFRDWLTARPEGDIAVIGHGTFFFHLTGVRLANCEILRWRL